MMTPIPPALPERNPTSPISSPLKSLAFSVFESEGQGILSLKSLVDSGFTEAVDLIHQTKGRLILSGMGKCSHIAHKIAATFASTGQPAFFVHPAEASHGDLGMITPEDTVLVLSNSGETAELSSLTAYTHRFSIPLLSIVGRANSTLARLSTLALVLPKKQEACPLNLAPTTSTTMMLALGDALAVCLLHKKGFTPQDFRVLHPGGSLGNQLSKVGEKMHGIDSIPLVEQGTSMEKGLLVMTEKGFGCLGVVDDNQMLLGVITDGDLRRHMCPNLLIRPVESVMTVGPTTVSPQTLMADALAILNKKGITSLFVVVDRNRPVGLIHVHDFLRAGIL